MAQHREDTTKQSDSWRDAGRNLGEKASEVIGEKVKEAGGKATAIADQAKENV